MIDILKFPVHVSLNKEDELHLTNPSTVDGWKVIHLLKTKVTTKNLYQIAFYFFCFITESLTQHDIHNNYNTCYPVLLHKSITDSSNPNAARMPSCLPSQEKVVLLQLYLCQRKCALLCHIIKVKLPPLHRTKTLATG